MDLNKELDLLKKENEELKDKIRKLQIIEDLFYWDKKMKPTVVENIVMILDSVFEDNTFKYVKKTEVYHEIYTELKNRFNLDLLSKYIKAKNLNRTKTQGVLEYTSELHYDTLLLDLIIYLYPRNANKILKYSNNLFSNEYTRVCEKFSKE
jgi:hypothetical protein